MNTFVLIFGIAWCLCGITYLILSSKTMTRKIEKYKDEYEIEQICFDNKIKGILYLLFGIGILIVWTI